MAFAGTAHEADTAQLPQSTSPVAAFVSGLGWTCRRVADEGMVATLRAPMTPVVAHSVDVDVIGHRRRVVDLEAGRSGPGPR